MSAPPEATLGDTRDDLLTVAALAAIAYVLSMLAHEALGHGLACVAGGGRVTTLWALDLGCDLHALPPATARVWERMVAAAGPLTPALIGGALLLSLRTWAARVIPNDAASNAPVPLFAWMLAALLLLPNIGYLCLAPARWGDAAIALAGTLIGARVLISIVGAASYWLTARTLFRLLSRLLRGSHAWRRGRDVAWCAYAIAAVLAFGAGARQAGAASTVGLSGLSGTVALLAGASGLVWGTMALRRPAARTGHALRPLTRHATIVVVGVVAALAFVGVLAPGVRFR